MWTLKAALNGVKRSEYFFCFCFIQSVSTTKAKKEKRRERGGGGSGERGRTLQAENALLLLVSVIQTLSRSFRNVSLTQQDARVYVTCVRKVTRRAEPTCVQVFAKQKSLSRCFFWGNIFSSLCTHELFLSEPIWVGCPVVEERKVCCCCALGPRAIIIIY